MRLLCAKTLQFHEPPYGKIPKYAILSHCWGSNELSHQAMRDAISHDRMKSEVDPIWRKSGFVKIYNFSRQALEDGHEFIWVDTCCIDKSSSAELQEAINSMYHWYRDSEVCYAYLDDVSIPRSRRSRRRARNIFGAICLKSLGNSKWFTRGWTLQELLAPRKLVFWDREWRRIGTLGELAQEIETITSIPIDDFSRDGREDRVKLWEARVARRMAWAANRETTRVEDSAYSLLGLFDVYMPMLYGEGQRAFQRLQEEILKVRDDSSILAWSSIDTDMDFASNGLAISPAHFQKYPKLVGSQKSCPLFVEFNARMMPRGLQVTLKIQKDVNDQGFGYAVLMETTRRHPQSVCLVLPIIFTRLSSRPGQTNECIRLSDPLWVSSTFLRKARPIHTCFIRNVQAEDLRRSRVGFSLRSRVWEAYATSFTYPIQTKPGHRHFPALFGGLPASTVGESKHTFVLELEERTRPSQRFVILIDYHCVDGNSITVTAITVMKLRKPINLTLASRLAMNQDFRSHFKLHNSLPCHGSHVLKTDIIDINRFVGYWIHPQDDELDTLPSQLAIPPATMALRAAIHR